MKLRCKTWMLQICWYRGRAKIYLKHSHTSRSKELWGLWVPLRMGNFQTRRSGMQTVANLTLWDNQIFLICNQLAKTSHRLWTWISAVKISICSRWSNTIKCKIPISRKILTTNQVSRSRIICCNHSSIRRKTQFIKTRQDFRDS